MNKWQRTNEEFALVPKYVRVRHQVLNKGRLDKFFTKMTYSWFWVGFILGGIERGIRNDWTTIVGCMFLIVYATWAIKDALRN